MSLRKVRLFVYFFFFLLNLFFVVQAENFSCDPGCHPLHVTAIVIKELYYVNTYLVILFPFLSTILTQSSNHFKLPLYFS